MIGKTVYANYLNPATEQYSEVTGLVSAVTIKNGEAYVNVDDNEVPASAVTVVGDDYFTASQLNSIYEGVANTRDMNFVGRYVQALIMDGENVSEYVEGQVEYVKFNGSQAVLVVGSKEIFPSEVASVADGPFLVGKSIIAEVTAETEDGTANTFRETIIRGVTIKDNKAYLEVDGGTIPIDKINYVMEALQYVGQHISYSAYDGEVDSVTVKNGIPYLNIGDQELSYLAFKEQ